MCTCYAFTAPSLDLALHTGLPVERLTPPRPRYRIRPRENATVIHQPDSSGLKVEEMTWGLIPSWSRDGSQNLFNARSETAFKLPSFRNGIQRRRCIVPASGFFEWQGQKGAKRPYYFHSTDDNTLMLAGLWERWHDAAKPGGASLTTFTILTQQAGHPVVNFHERQPVILHPADLEHWFDPRADRNLVADIMQAAGNVDLAVRPVSRLLLRQPEGPHSIAEAA